MRNSVQGRIRYRRKKTGGEVDVPIVPELWEVLDLVPRSQLLFVCKRGGVSYAAAAFGNKFKGWCVQGGLSDKCALHGLRKRGATDLAESAGSEYELMSWLGHATPDEARTYTKKANRAKLNDSAMAKRTGANREQGLTNRVERLDKARRKAFKEKRN